MFVVNRGKAAVDKENTTNYTPKSIKRTLKRSLSQFAAAPEKHTETPEKDFTRNRKLPFEAVLKAVLPMMGKSLRGELVDLFGLKLDAPTVSTFVQQRNKLNFRAFEEPFHTFTQANFAVLFMQKMRLLRLFRPTQAHFLFLFPS